ncbi:hypothetical protein V7S43_010279 [Phytophthora oleae]|uniref:Uncharacterized protein n=1 Tax=Phytophthora oleae TaxID=2107226 RepID=A0ABD3FFQ4_9STRA
MKSVQRNKHVIRAVLDDNSLDIIYKDNKSREKLAKARALVSEAGFWAKLDAVLLLLHPINAVLAEFESDGSFVSAVFHQFRQLSRNKVYHEELDNSVYQFRFLQDEIRDFIAMREVAFITPSMKKLDTCLINAWTRG